MHWATPPSASSRSTHSSGVASTPGRSSRPLVPRFQLANTALCPFTSDAPELFRRWWNDPELIINMGDWDFMPFPYQNRTPEEYCEAVRKTTWLIGSVEEDGHVEPIGYAGIYQKGRHRVGIYRIAITEPEFRRQGHACRATEIFLEWSFRYLDLFAVHLSVTSSNGRAIRLYERSGFKICGRYTQSRYEPTGRSDEIHMEILRDWWEDAHRHV